MAFTHKGVFLFKERVLIIILFFLGCTSHFGQDYVNILRLYGQYSPDAEYNDGIGKTDLKEFGTRILLPVPLKNDRVLLPGLFFEKVQGKLSPNHIESTTVYTITPQIGMQFKYSEQWKANYILMPSINSDLENLDSDDMQLGAICLFTKTKSETLNFQYGLYVNTEVYGLNVLPLVGMYYISDTRKFEADLFLPVYFDLNYRLDNKLRLGIQYLGRGTTHNLNSYGTDKSGYYLEKGSQDLYAYIEVPLMKDWVIQGMIGHSFGRYYEVYDRDEKLDWAIGSILFGDDREQVNGDISDGLVVKFKLIYRYPLKK